VRQCRTLSPPRRGDLRAVMARGQLQCDDGAAQELESHDPVC
jgi:hypothetical protein